jgi:alpha-tubulin suppressor-like RCC1 family protein
VNLLTKLQAALRRDSENPTGPKGGVRRRPESNTASDEERESNVPGTHTRPQGDALRAKFDQVGIKQIALSKFHTAILTTESRGNLSLSGVSGNVCRLGQRGVHSQYPLVPMQDASGGLNDVQVDRVALGTDHTLVVTSKGYLYSWGGNRFAQLGYVIDDGSEAAGTSTANTPASGNFSTSTSTEQSLVQTTPRRILGTLKKEEIIGCAASRLSSACWTAEKGGLWTWGTNMGHLGYDKAMTQGGVQIAPRKVTGISQGIVDVAMTVSRI